jgi:hypothetical protein
MPGLGFGAFLAPHHPIGEHPPFRRDLDFVERLDRLGYDVAQRMVQLDYMTGARHANSSTGSTSTALARP